MEAVLRLPRLLAVRLQTSPLFMTLAAIPMIVIVVLVSVLAWISFQTGIIGTMDATYTFNNYVEILADPFVSRVVGNTVIFTLVTTFIALGFGQNFYVVKQNRICTI